MLNQKSNINPMGNKIKPRKLDYQVLQAKHKHICKNMAYSSKWQRGILRRVSPGVRIGETSFSSSFSLYIHGWVEFGTPGQRRSQGQTRCTWAEAEPGADQVHLRRGGPGLPLVCAAGRQKRKGEHVTHVYTDIHSKSTIFLKNVLTWGFKLPCLFLAFEPVLGLMPRKHLKTISQDNHFNFT